MKTRLYKDTDFDYNTAKFNLDGKITINIKTVGGCIFLKLSPDEYKILMEQLDPSHNSWKTPVIPRHQQFVCDILELVESNGDILNLGNKICEVLSIKGVQYVDLDGDELLKWKEFLEFHKEFKGGDRCTF